MQSGPTQATAEPIAPPIDWDARHLEMLQRMIEQGMALSEALARQGMARAAAAEAALLRGVADGEGPVEVAFAGAIELAYARVTKSVRMAMAAHRDIRKQQAREAAAAEEAAGGDSEQHAAAERVRAMLRDIAIGPCKDDVRAALDQVIEDQPIEPRQKEWLRGEVSERLEDETEAQFNLPTSATIAKLCRDLGLKPDWERWTHEPWAVEEAQNSSPYTRVERFEGERESVPRAADTPDGNNPWPFPNPAHPREGGDPGDFHSSG